MRAEERESEVFRESVVSQTDCETVIWLMSVVGGIWGTTF